MVILCIQLIQKCMWEVYKYSFILFQPALMASKTLSVAGILTFCLRDNLLRIWYQLQKNTAITDLKRQCLGIQCYYDLSAKRLNQFVFGQICYCKILYYFWIRFCGDLLYELWTFVSCTADVMTRLRKTLGQQNSPNPWSRVTCQIGIAF